MKTKIVIQNVVASARIDQEIDLYSIVRYFQKVDYRPEVFPGLPFRIENPKSCVLIFKNGKMVCTGTKSVKEAEQAIKKAIHELREVQIITTEKEPEITIQNIVASVELIDILIDIENAIYELCKIGRILYEPDMFPGAIYRRMENPKVVILIFASGKLICVGAKKEKDVYKAVEELVTFLEKKGLLTEK